MFTVAAGSRQQAVEVFFLPKTRCHDPSSVKSVELTQECVVVLQLSMFSANGKVANAEHQGRRFRKDSG